jgi:hypothetical protein
MKQRLHVQVRMQPSGAAHFGEGGHCHLLCLHAEVGVADFGGGANSVLVCLYRLMGRGELGPRA